MTKDAIETFEKMDELDCREDVFQQYLFNNLFQYEGKNREKVFERLYSHAYQIGHSSGYLEVATEFEEINDFVLDVLKCINGGN